MTKTNLKNLLEHENADASNEVTSRNVLPVTEIFLSIQGEGTLIGTPMVFIRLWGCNMACTWCDTTYSWAPEYHGKTPLQKFTPQELASHLMTRYPNVSWFNFTGGEPTIHWKRIIHVIKILKENKKLTCIQTNGKAFPPELIILDKICMDVKCPTSGEQSQLEYITRLRPQDDLKFVIANEKDWKFMEKVVSSHETKATIILQPVLWENEDLSSYYERIRWMVQKLKQSPALLKKEKIRILPQFHQLLWRDVPGT